MKTKYRWRCLIIISLVCVVLATIGCRESPSSSTSIKDCGYKTFTTWDKEFRGWLALNQPDFTFEYPGCFEPHWPPTPENKNTTLFNFDRQVKNDLMFSALRVVVGTPGDKGIPPSAQSSIDSFVSGPSNKNEYKYFSVIDRNQRSVNGITAESATISIHVDDNNKPSSDISWRTVGFESRGFLWTMIMICPKDEATEVMPYFEHFLDTFKIVENPPVTN